MEDCADCEYIMNGGCIMACPDCEKENDEDPLVINLFYCDCGNVYGRIFCKTCSAWTVYDIDTSRCCVCSRDVAYEL